MNNYTIGQLAKLAGISVRTLHHYDKKGLLSPLHKDKKTMYRFYGENELLRLQQIMFYKELGFALIDIKKLLNKSSFELLSSLETQHKMFMEKIEHNKKLMETIEYTIKSLKEKTKMETKKIFQNLTTTLKENPPAIFTDVNNCTNGIILKEIEKSFDVLSTMSMDEIRTYNEESQNRFKWFVDLVKKGFSPKSPEVQEYFDSESKRAPQNTKLFESQTLMDKGYYQGIIKFYQSNKATRDYMDTMHPGLADFMCQAMKIFIKNKLK